MKRIMSFLITLAMLLSCSVTAVNAIETEATTITLNPDYVELWVNFGDECRLAASVTGSSPEQTLTWVSSDNAVAQVSQNGNIIPVSPGVTYITAYATDGSGAVSNTVTVKVTEDRTPAPDQLVTLGAATGNRINTQDFLANPAVYGNAHIALWYGNATGAVTITCDDSITGDFSRWNTYLEDYGIPTTFFVPLKGLNSNGDYWEQQLDAGHAVQSHTTYHNSGTVYNTWTSAQVWMDNYLAAQSIDRYTTTPSRVIAYSYGWNDPVYSSKIYIAGRGTAGISNQAASVNYNNVNSFSCGPNTNFDAYIATLYDPSVRIYNTSYYAGWSSLHFHGISGANVTGDPDVGMANLYNAIINAGEGVIWADTFANVAMYGQERDTATLTVTEIGANRFRLNVTDLMNDGLFDMPLTVKIAVDGTWQHAVSEQGGVRRAVKIVTDGNGARFLMVDAVPDRGEVTVTRCNEEPDLTAEPDYGTVGEGGDYTALSLLLGAVTPTEGDCVTVSDTAELMALADYVNRGNSCAGLTVLLCADLDFTGVSHYQPIGRLDKPFCGTFDGRGHTIRGLEIEHMPTKTGVFGYASGATIKDLNVCATVTGTENVGGIVGLLSGGSVTGCTFSGTVNAGGLRSAGIVGGAGSGAYIKNCINYGNVVSTSDNAGGIVGGSNHFYIYNCANYGSISANTYAGSVTGCILSTSSGTPTQIVNCLAAGSVTAKNYAGGLCPQIGSNNSFRVKNCLVTAQVICTATPGDGIDTLYVGGVTGRVVRGGNNPAPSDIYYTPAVNTGLSACPVTDTGATIVITEFAAASMPAIMARLNTWVDGDATEQYDSWSYVTVNEVALPSPVGTPDGELPPSPPPAGGSSGYWDGVTADTEFDGQGTAGSPYLIGSEAELMGLAKLVNEATADLDDVLFSAKHYRLTRNLIMNPTENYGSWSDEAPINVIPSIGHAGRGTIEDPDIFFSGVFDGDGYTVYGIYQNVTDTRAAGLFAGITGGAVRDLSISHFHIAVNYQDESISSLTSAAGALAGYCVNTSIAGVSVQCGTVTARSLRSDPKKTTLPYCGGVVGNAVSCTITECSNSAEVWSVNGNNSSGSGAMKTYGGGIVGSITGTSGTYATVMGCSNSGTVHGYIAHNSQASWFGGIAGYASYTNIGTCLNRGQVHYDTINTNPGSAGGILGEGSNAKLDGCFNTGSVASKLTAGGMAAKLSGSMLNCESNCAVSLYATATATSKLGGLVGEITGNCTVNNSTCAGTVTDASALAYTGGLVGYTTARLTMDNCLAYPQISGSAAYCGGLVGYYNADATSVKFTSCHTTAATAVVARSGANTLCDAASLTALTPQMLAGTVKVNGTQTLTELMNSVSGTGYDTRCQTANAPVLCRAYAMGVGIGAANITLSNDISVNFLIPYTGAATDDTAVRSMLITAPDGSVHTVTCDGTPSALFGEDYLRFTLPGLAACDAEKTIYGRLLCTVAGVTVEVANVTYSVLTYAANIYDSATAEMKNVLETLFYYADAAQTARGDGATALAALDGRLESFSADDSYLDRSYAALRLSGRANVTAGVVSQCALVDGGYIHLVMKLCDKAVRQVSINYGGRLYTYEASDGEFTADCFYATSLYRTFTVTAGGKTSEYSISNYIASGIDGHAFSENEKTLAMAMALYMDAVCQYRMSY